MKAKIIPLIVASFSMALSAMAGLPAELCQVGNSYTLVLANPQANPIPGPGGTANGRIACKVIESNGGDWIKIEFTSQQISRNPSDPGQVDSKSTTHQAWVNLEHVSMLILQPEAKPKE